MTSEEDEPMERNAAFPPAMQGRWVEQSEPSFEVIVEGSEIIWRGVHVDYRTRTLRVFKGGFTWVKVDFSSQTAAGDVLNLVNWPGQDIHAFSDHISARLVRADSQERSDDLVESSDPAIPSAKVELVGREAAFPREMQGSWVDDSDPTFDLVVDGADLRWRGVESDYLNKTFTTHDDGTVCVTVEFPDQEADYDSLEMVIVEDGSMYAYNVHAAGRYVRPV